MTKEAEWSARVDAWRESGKSATAFCQGQDYAASKLYWWARKLKRNGRGPKRVQMALARVVRTSPLAAAAAPIVIQFGPARIEVSAGADPTALSHVLHALAREPWGGGR